MRNIRRSDPALLPGARGPEAVKAYRSSARYDEVGRARRRATVRDVADLLLLLAIDVFFVAWPSTRLPFIDRHSTLELLMLAHAAFAIYMIWSRFVPKWRARRIASTWCRNEQQRFAR